MVPSSVAPASLERRVVSQKGRVTSRQYSSRNEDAMAWVEMNVSAQIMLVFYPRLLTPGLLHGALRFGKTPTAIQDLFARLIQPDGVVPSGHGGQAIRNLAVAPPELDDNRTIGAFF